MKPRIAVNCDIEGYPRKKATVPVDYLDAVQRAGGIPVMVPPVEGGVSLLGEVQGMLLIGGNDYRLANEAGIPNDFQAVDERREAMDIALAEHCLAADLPVLGICCGFQLLVLVAGGTLYGDLPSDAPGPVLHKRKGDGSLARHPVSWLEEVPRLPIACGRHAVNSHHHQGIRDLAPEWRALAHSDDGLVEAASGPGRYQLGVQWHPEKDADAQLSRILMESFVEAARR